MVTQLSYYLLNCLKINIFYHRRTPGIFSRASGSQFIQSMAHRQKISSWSDHRFRHAHPLAQ
jgi:hypothetical protein